MYSMKKTAKILSLLAIVTLLLSLAACSNTKPQGDDDMALSTSITVIDHNGNSVNVPRNIERIVVCDIYPLPSVLAIFFDSAEKIVGMAPPSMTAAQNSLLSELYPEILQAETGFIDGTNVNIEELIKLNPDVVFYTMDNPILGKQIANAGLTGVAISTSNWDYNATETLNQWIALLSEIFPENDKADAVKEYSDWALELVKERTASLTDEERQRIFFLFQYSDTMITTSGKRFFGQWWAESIGAVNVSGELDMDKSAVVSMEQIYKWNPQHILITNFNPASPQDLYENKIGNYDWSGIEAVQNRKVVKMPLGLYRSYTCGADTPVTLLWLAKTIYPERFADLDITQETKKYYQTVFGLDLTDQQAEKIFAPSSEASAY